MKQNNVGDFELLAASIMRLAALDYMKARRYNIQHLAPTTEAEEVRVWKNQQTIKECVSYFKGPLFALSMQMDPDVLIRMLDEKAASDEPLMFERSAPSELGGIA